MNERHIFVCDDEPELREIVREYLESRGFRVTEAGDVAQLRALMEYERPDAVILDIRMPREDGLSALRSIRATSDVPVIMVTAADGVIDRVVGLELGADDYVGKPVDLRELEARLKSILRRGAGAATAPAQGIGAAAPGGGGKVAFGDCTLDLGAVRLLDAEGREVPITAMEFDLLRVFHEHRGRVLNRDQLLDLAHNRGWDPFDRSIDLRISRLRRKIEADPRKPQIIRTIRGIGYVFDPDRRLV